METEKDRDAAYKENELGFGHELKDGDVNFNPIATGVPHSDRVKDALASEMMERKNEANHEKADVMVEKFKHKQELGQISSKPPRAHPLSQPLLEDGRDN